MNTLVRQHFGPLGKPKKPFASRPDAAAYADRLNEKPGASKRRPYHAYKCRDCSQFHVGRRKA